MRRFQFAVGCAFACVAFFGDVTPAKYNPSVAMITRPAAHLVQPAAASVPAIESVVATENVVPTEAVEPSEPENPIADTDTNAPADAASTPRKPTSLERARAALADSNAQALSDQELCTKLVEVARANDLPLGFFTNLIWQESRFD